LPKNENGEHLVVYGGNGYVGSKILELAAADGFRCSSVSRGGIAPAYLQNSQASWLECISWLTGNALQPDPKLLASADVVICAIGSPPVPTFTQSAFAKQLEMNGATNTAVIRAATQQSVKRLVLLGADIPSLMKRQGFAYYLGKLQVLAAAQEFADRDPEHCVTVLQPSAIYGTRHSKRGWAIPLSPFLAPIAWLINSMPEWLRRKLPASPVALESVARAAVSAARDTAASGLHIIDSEQLRAISLVVLNSD